MDPLSITSIVTIATAASDLFETLYQARLLSSECRAFQQELSAFQQELASLKTVLSKTDPGQPKDTQGEKYLRYGTLLAKLEDGLEPTREAHKLLLGEKERSALSADWRFWEPLGLLATKTVIPALQYVLLSILQVTGIIYAASKGISPNKDAGTQFPSPFRHDWVVKSCIWGLLLVAIVGNISILFCLGWRYRMLGMRTLLCWITFAAVIMARFWIQSGGSLETFALVALPFGISVGMSCARLQQAMAKKYHCRREPSPKQDICIEKGLPHSATTV